MRFDRRIDVSGGRWLVVERAVETDLNQRESYADVVCMRCCVRRQSNNSYALRAASENETGRVIKSPASNEFRQQKISTTAAVPRYTRL